ncbi:MAG: gliding motility-associated C-terminal domain-containing protein [Chitinophagaceae bacterium]|nr:gliding motility-associated C-terminal domain-containing protein [Chitinophagaceae bacterium]
MRRFLLSIVIFILVSAPSQAAHIKGGFFSYQYLGPGITDPSANRYRITLTVYMLCIPSDGQLSNPINFTIFNAGNNQFLQNVSVPITNQYTLDKLYDEPCITGDQRGCYYYIVVYDLPSIELAADPDGYIIAYQRCCRIAGINNVVASGTVGNTFTIQIPGTAAPLNAYRNSSPQFLINDTAVVCAGSFFQYSFRASDIDGDSLSYQFCYAYLGADQSNSAPPTATNPPYSSVPYQSPFSGTQPMGAGVTIHPVTGLISGIAPPLSGEYVVCVCVNEYKNGVLIATSRKELHIRAGDCIPLSAMLNPKPTTCDGFTVNFQNDAPGNPPGTEYFWTFGEPSSGNLDTSILAAPSHTYATAGTFTVRLKVSLAGGLCADSTFFQVNVFPGFFPGFTAAGGCFQNPFQFTDTTKTSYGFVDTWRWDFGDLTTNADTSHLQNPQWTYASSGQKTVTLNVTNSKGCFSTVQFIIDVLDKPLITLAFRDTLICRTDAVQLNASGTGAFNWTPPVNIINANTGTPTVNPPSTQWYYVNLDDNGCLNKDSVQVRVVNSVTLKAMNDTTICQGDAIQLNAISDGLTYSWTPAANLNNPNIINPVAITFSTTPYNVVASIGSCSANDQVIVTTVPYPIADAGIGPTLCYNTPGQLNASIVGISFSWSPTSYLNNPNILNPLSTPPRTTQYILSAFDTLGCPKPGRDTIVVTVNPKVKAFAGRDTTVVVGQPLLFNGTGGVNYLWSPSTGLSNTAIFNPIGIYDTGIDSVRYKLVVSDATGCADSAFVTVYVFKTNPSIFVPTAFTPNNDGLNDVVRPIAVGIRQINYFSVYNRWGERVFTTNVNRQGWDGRINGRVQNSGVFVWMVSAIDYLGKPIFLKGTVTLIR